MSARAMSAQHAQLSMSPHLTYKARLVLRDSKVRLSQKRPVKICGSKGSGRSNGHGQHTCHTMSPRRMDWQDSMNASEYHTVLLLVLPLQGGSRLCVTRCALDLQSIV